MKRALCLSRKIKQQKLTFQFHNIMNTNEKFYFEIFQGLFSEHNLQNIDYKISSDLLFESAFGGPVKCSGFLKSCCDPGCDQILSRDLHRSRVNQHDAKRILPPLSQLLTKFLVSRDPSSTYFI